MAEPELLTQVVEGVGVLRLNRPAAINALTVAMMRGMREALESWRDDEGVDSVLLLGEGSRGLCAGELEDNRSWIDACYCFPDPSDVIAALESHADSRARAAAALIRARSPLSVAVTLEAMRRVPTMTGVADVLAQDRVLADHMIGSPDFIEGVRAQLVDKDRTPRWSHDRIEDVTRAEVLACFRTEEPSSLTF